MIGSWRWNVIAAVALAAVIFLVSYSHNPIATAGTRTGIAFAVGFVLTYAVRWMLGQAAAAEPAPPEKERPAEDEQGKGQSIDLTTPDDEGEALPSDFAPLVPPKLTRKAEDEEEMKRIAEAFRQMSEK